MANVVLENVFKIYPGNVTAVHDANLEIHDQEFVILVGPSGCGKSTTLRMIAGLEEITKGDIYIGGRRVNDVPPKDRDIAMVFQNYALYPHMSVYKNTIPTTANSKGVYTSKFSFDPRNIPATTVEFFLSPFSLTTSLSLLLALSLLLPSRRWLCCCCR